MSDRKLAVIGLDCAAPQLVFDRFRAELPILGRLRAGGAWGKLRSTDPPITIPAWAAMFSGKDPGQLGIYGFRNFRGRGYDEMSFATARAVREPLAWDALGAAGKKSILMGFPPSYPPRPVNGWSVGCFLTPDAGSEYTWPPELKPELAALVGDYRFDVKGFRTEDKDWLLEQIWAMTRQHFTVARHLVREKAWDFFLSVEQGVDRIHHGFWKYCDPGHRKYEAGTKYEHALRDYYRMVDDELGQLLAAMPADTAVLVVSDHGAKRMEGGFCINEWLRREGYLELQSAPSAPTPLGKAPINWARTRAWGEGGYFSRIMLNVAGRQPQGVVPPEGVAALKQELKRKLEALPDDRGRPMGNRVLFPEDLYPVRNGIPPDLMVYLGNLSWRSVGSVGVGSLYTQDNDTGPDDANHDFDGIFIGYDPARPGSGRELTGLELYDIGPTVLRHYGLPVPPDWRGRPITW